MLSTIEMVTTLKTIGVFSGTPDEILAEIASLLEEIELAAEETIFEKGHLGDCMYIIVSGEVRVHDGERTLNHLGERDVFGEMAVLDPEPRMASVTTVENTKLLRLDQESFYKLMDQRIEIVRGIIRVLSGHLRARVQDLAKSYARIADLTQDDMNTVSQLRIYISDEVRTQIESQYYAKTDAQASLVHLSTDELFLRAPLRHPVTFADHGVVHVRDVAATTVKVLRAGNGVLFPARDLARLEFMKELGVVFTYLHDIGMMNLSKFGRAMHPEFATQMVMSPEFDPLLEMIWDNGQANIAQRLITLRNLYVIDQDPKVALREVISMANAHSKSKVPIAILNDPNKLRGVMQESAGSNLRYLYNLQRINKINGRLKQAQSNGKDKSHIDRLSQELAEVEMKLAQMGPHIEVRHHNYNDFKQESYRWLTSTHGAVKELIRDIVDTLRAVRTADALRQRGTGLRTTGGHQVFVDQTTGKAIVALYDDAKGYLFLLESSDPLSIGESNIAGSEITWSGDLLISFQKGHFATLETTRKVAKSVAIALDDVQSDIIESFKRPTPLGSKYKKMSQEIMIVLENVADNPQFAKMVKNELQIINPTLKDRVKIVPTQVKKDYEVDNSEYVRYKKAQTICWSVQARQQILDNIAKTGAKIKSIDIEKAFENVKLIRLIPGETLIKASSQAHFVYIPMGNILTARPLGGYRDLSIHAWVLLGNTAVVSDTPRNATVTARQQAMVLMIPKATFLDYWHDPYTPEELKAVLPTFYPSNL